LVSLRHARRAQEIGQTPKAPRTQRQSFNFAENAAGEFRPMMRRRT
jgi:hypothetical protein